MKNIIVLIILLSPVFLFATSGVYATQEDFLNKKLTKVCDGISVTQVAGNYTIILHTGDKSEKIALKNADFWGFKRDTTDFRIINHLPRAIATKGEIYFYSDYFGWLEIKKDDVIFHKTDNTYPMASKGIDGQIVTLHTYKDLYNLMKPELVPAIKKELTRKNIAWCNYMEGIADYYNSQQPGYVGPRITVVDYGNPYTDPNRNR
jgi:hypothetical protein